MAKDYYGILGVSPSASQKEIKAAFRKLARQYHPDVAGGDPGAEKRFKAINEAYEVVGDPENRQKYDKYGENWMHAEEIEKMAQEQRTRTGAWSYGFGSPRDGQSYTFQAGEGGVDFEDILGDLFGAGRSSGRSRTPRKARGEDLFHPVEISLEEAFSGTTRLIQMEKPDAHGAVRPRRLEVKIPAGVAEGSKVRIAGEGSPGINGGAPGDLYLVISVAPHLRFERRGDDLYADIPVPLTDAILGSEVEVPTPSGKKLALKIPPETQNGRTFRLSGKGMPRPGGGHGDLYARVNVVLPTGLSSQEQELFEKLRRERAGVS